MFTCPVHGKVPVQEIEYNTVSELTSVYSVRIRDDCVIFEYKDEVFGDMSDSYFDHVMCGERVEVSEEVSNMDFEYE